MSSTSLIWLFIGSAVALSALLAFSPRLDAAKLSLLARLRSSRGRFGHDREGSARTLIVPAAVFLLVAGIGAALSSYVGYTPPAIDSHLRYGPNDDALERLKDYSRSIGTEAPASAPAPDKLLPDVNTMTERLAARLETAPEDVKGWRMLGWSYFHTGRYEQAAAAYAKAVALDPNSAEMKASYEEAKAKASSPTGASDKGGDGVHVEKTAKSEGMPAHGQGAAVRSMVDGLAKRLESAPRDAEGWIRLIRSRVVLGERDAAETAFRKALEVFRDDSAASGNITATAISLGLKAE